MKKGILLLIAVFIGNLLFAQDFTGQWKGYFSDKSTSFVGWGGNKCDYVLEIECSGTTVTGYSYTYFNEGGKKYYTICRLKGTLNKGSKSIEVVEVERTKTNVPNTIRNCFQVHRLTYFKQGEDQTLEGTWVPAPKQEGDCGYGTTTLTRRVLQKNPSLLTNTNTPPVKTTSKPPLTTQKDNKMQPPVLKNTPLIVVPPVVKQKPPTNTATPKNTTPPVVKNDSPVKETNVIDNGAVSNKESSQKQAADKRLESRNNDLLKTIEIENESFKVDLYDNGDIDGDSISLFFNGKLLLSHKRLSDKAISLTLNADDSKDVNELVMYAENLGLIPPNTALMVVTDGENRYEVRISSDLQKSGVIRFIHKPKKGQ